MKKKNMDMRGIWFASVFVLEHVIYRNLNFLSRETAILNTDHSSAKFSELMAKMSMPASCSLGGSSKYWWSPVFLGKPLTGIYRATCFLLQLVHNAYPFRWPDQLPSCCITCFLLQLVFVFWGGGKNILFLWWLKLKSGMRNSVPFFLNLEVWVMHQLWRHWAPRGGLEISHKWVGSSTTDTAAQL